MQMKTQLIVQYCVSGYDNFQNTIYCYYLASSLSMTFQFQGQYIEWVCTPLPPQCNVGYNSG